MNMGNIHLVTGYAGKEHVTAADQGAFNAALLGHGQFVLNKGNHLSASMVTVNQIRVLDGDIYMQGRHIRLNEGGYADVAIENGTQGYMRHDLIVARYTRDEVSGVEDVNLVAIKGDSVTSSPADPECTFGDIIDGHAVLNEMPLYRVPLNGLNVGSLVPLFTVRDVNIPDMDEAKQDKTDKLTEESGIADADFLPFYDASVYGHRKTAWANIKAVLSSVFASKDHTHTLSALGAAASAHKHAATDINSGILPVTRGGTGVSSLPALFSALGAAKTELISYVGTGGTGANNPTVITCSFAPKVLVLIGSGSASTFSNAFVNDDVKHCNTMLPAALMPTEYAMGYGLGYDNVNHQLYGKRSSDGKTISWYDDGSHGVMPEAFAQCNHSDTTYYFLAIG